MDMAKLTSFFKWCTLMNGGLLVLWIALCSLAPDLVYATQSNFFPIPREAFDLMIYGFLGLFKLLFLIFNVVPYLALKLIE